MVNRAAKILLGLAVVAVVFAALPWKPFELDRYFVPKELVLNAAALIIAAMLFIRPRTISYDLADALLALFLLWSAASALFATNYWLAQRALGLSVASALIFWGARKIGATGSYRLLIGAVAVATVCAAVTALSALSAPDMKSNCGRKASTAAAITARGGDRPNSRAMP